MDVADSSNATRPSGEMTSLRSWTASQFRSLSRALASVLASALAAETPASWFGVDPPKLLFTPDVVSSSDYYFHTWQPGEGETKKLSCAAGGLPEGAHVSPVTRPLHGLVLLRCGPPPAAAGYCVCNPSTGAVLPLPDSRLPLKMAGRMHDPNTWRNYVRYGLGYSEATKEYKAVRLFSVVCGHEESRTVVSTSCEVLVLDASPQWRPAVGRPPVSLNFYRSTDAAVYLDGVLHFLCDDPNIIATFDVSGETFGSLPPPPNQFPAAKLAVLDGRLCIHHESPSFTSGKPYCVWTLSAGSWELLCRIDVSAFPYPLRIQGYSFTPLYMRQRRILFGTPYGCKVFAAEAAGRGSSEPQVLFSPCELAEHRELQFLRVGLLEESAVPVGRTSEEVVFSSPSAAAWSEVLKRLPAREVARLNLVCRDLRAMIQTDRFARLHAAHYASLQQMPRIMVFHDALSAVEFIALERLQSTPKLPPVTNERTRVFSSKPCHGLNLVTSGNTDFICNPVTGSYHCIMRRNNEHDVFFVASHIGLAYHPVVKKHMLVRLTRRDDLVVCEVRYINDYSWRTAGSPPRRVTDAPPVFVKEKLYWMADSKQELRSSRCEIMAFNVCTASFEVLQGPQCGTLVDEGERVSILELKGTLCVAHSYPKANSIEVWAMKNNVEWSLEYHIQLNSFSSEYLSEETTPLAVDPNDGRILLTTGRALGYYDTKTAALETIYRLGKTPIDGNYRFTPILCHETLVCPF